MPSIGQVAIRAYRKFLSMGNRAMFVCVEEMLESGNLFFRSIAFLLPYVYGQKIYPKGRTPFRCTNFLLYIRKLLLGNESCES